ncbi:MAG: DUF5667 domain-containing protein [Patescibacteria group bacterium]|nr:DUF5667 domain-containing protein [Patescibacteria group bacterium]
MRKKYRVFIFSFILFLSFNFLFVPRVLANRHAKILGVATTSQKLSIPPTVEGPGLILPDSPLFFLDQLKQATRIYTAFKSETKAEIYKDIAGERFAELRFMLARNNKPGIKLTLDGIESNLEMAANEINQAQMRGKNVSKLAKSVNDSIKEKQEVLDQLQLQTTGELRARIESVQESLLASKIIVEDSLMLADLDNEIRYDLARRIRSEVRNTIDSVKLLQEQIDELNEQATQASEQMLVKREEALSKTIQQKNEALIQTQEQLLLQEKEKQTRLLGAQTTAMEQVKEALENAQKAAIEFEKTQGILDSGEIPTITPIPTAIP